MNCFLAIRTRVVLLQTADMESRLKKKKVDMIMLTMLQPVVMSTCVCQTRRLKRNSRNLVEMSTWSGTQMLSSLFKVNSLMQD